MKNKAQPIMNARTTALDMLQTPVGIDVLFSACEQLQQQGKPFEVIALYESWLSTSQDPLRYIAWFNCGAQLQSAGKPTEAVHAYGQCLAIKPNFPQAIINLGLTLEKMGKRNEALQHWAQLVSLRLLNDGPADDMVVTALNHIGRVQEDLKQYDSAEQALEQSLGINPKQPGVIQHWVHIRQKACKWPVYKELPNISRNDMLMATSPLAMLAMTDDPVQQLLTAHAFVGRTYGFKEEFLSKGRQYNHERVRIGYVSGDLCVHAVGLLLPELLESHDKTKFEIYGYDFSPEDGTAHRQRLKNTFDHFRPIHHLNDRQVAEQVLADEIDVLIDLHGLSAGARPGIFALHPAPKQGTYLGFIGTTGMPWFDFVIADRHVLPEELTPYFTEKPLYLDGTFIPLTRDETPIREATRVEFGLPEDAFVMAAFGNVYKITEEMFNVWLDILKAATCSVLWLIDDNKTTTHQLKAYAEKKGADPSRIIFTSRAAHVEYLAKLRVADVFLDNFPYNCGSTTRDVANASLPMVTMHGKTMVSRMGLSIQIALGATNLIAHNAQEYTNIVLNLSKSTDRCDELRKVIKGNLEAYQSDPLKITYQLENELMNFVLGTKSKTFGKNP
jgi:predicted O-linked N-acetylglucosamine transferase (SPINDLY family)